MVELKPGIIVWVHFTDDIMEKPEGEWFKAEIVEVNPAEVFAQTGDRNYVLLKMFKRKWFFFREKRLAHATQLREYSVLDKLADL